MSDYYTPQADVAASTRARAVDINALDQAVSDGFDKLPAESNLKKGTTNYAETAGTATAYTVSLPHSPASYTDGLLVSAKIHVANSGANPTINVDGLGAKTIKLTDGAALAAGDMPLNGMMDFRYNEDTGFFHVSAAGSAAVYAATATAQATIATTQAGIATAQATIATTKAGEAATSEATATAAAATATTQAGTATTKAGEAATSATNAATSATNAATSESNATLAATAAITAYDQFDDRYLGAKAADPTTDNDGNALITGALYWNSVSNEMRAYSGTAWVAAYITPSGFATLTGAEMLSNKSFQDSTTYIVDDGDATKKAKFQASGITAGATRTMTIPDEDLTLAGRGANTFSGKQSAPVFIDGAGVNATATGSISLDLGTADVFPLTLSGNVTSATFTNVPTLAANEELTVVLRVKQGGTAYSFAYPTVTEWLTSGGTAPATPAANKTVEYVFTKTGAAGWVGRKGASN